MANTTVSTLPPDLFDQTTLISLASTVVLVAVAYGASLKALSPTTSGSMRFLFIWHAFDALTHFILEGGFLYHCFFSWLPVGDVTLKELREQKYFTTPHGFLGHTDRVYGSQAGGDNPLAQLWMVYAKADKRWAGVDLSVVSLELLTVFIMAPLSCLVCYDLAKKNPRANIVITVVATAELYGGFITFCPEWLTGNQYLDTSNFMYKWVYLVFFNMLWVFIPIYALYVTYGEIMDAFKVKSAGQKSKKTK